MKFALAIFLVLYAAPLSAQSFTLSMDGTTGLSGSAIQVFGLVTILSIVPGIAMMVTCFPFMVTVLSILRQGIGLQSAPPNMLIVSLALFLTYFVMEPVFLDAWQQGIEPLTRNEIALEVGLTKALEPFRNFMLARVDPETLFSLAELRGANFEAAPNSVLIPSFLLSEVTRAFQIGFIVFLPFLIIDLVVSAVLMSMGMMMVPPAIVSLPFKLAFFVVADGWTLVSTSLVNGYF